MYTMWNVYPTCLGLGLRESLIIARSQTKVDGKGRLQTYSARVNGCRLNERVDQKDYIHACTLFVVWAELSSSPFDRARGKFLIKETLHLWF